MEENNNNLTPDDKNKQKKPVKINSYWIYGAVIMMLILGQLLLFPSGTNSKISYDELKTYVEAGDVSKMVVINSDVAEIYLKKDLTIHDISKEINISSSYISNVLNQDLKCNFVTFINTYRINKAKEILLSSNYSTYTIEAISELVGFNSKSSFNSAFKQISGITPSEYKRKNK